MNKSNYINSKEKVTIFWFRRDLRLDDNHGLYKALKSPFPVLPLFIFDNEITDELENDDPRVTFIYELLEKLNKKLAAYSSSILCKKGKVIDIWKEIITKYNVQPGICITVYEW